MHDRVFFSFLNLYVYLNIRDETFEQEERKPRGFQQELIDTILKDNFNYIVFAPTGCGKVNLLFSLSSIKFIISYRPLWQAQLLSIFWRGESLEKLQVFNLFYT